jgi:hypothetical protein
VNPVQNPVVLQILHVLCRMFLHPLQLLVFCYIRKFESIGLVIEHIVTSHIMRHAERNNILYPLQHGFRSKRSCETLLLECIDNLTMNLENGKQTDLLILDFLKAFSRFYMYFVGCFFIHCNYLCSVI